MTRILTAAVIPAGRMMSTVTAEASGVAARCLVLHFALKCCQDARVQVACAQLRGTGGPTCELRHFVLPSGAYADRARLGREAPSGIDFGADLAGHLRSLLQEQETIDVG